MIGWVVGAAVALALGGAALARSTAQAARKPQPPLPSGPGPTVAGTGGSVALAVPADAVLAVSPFLQSMPQIGQVVGLAAVDPLGGVIEDPSAIPVQAITQAISPTDARIVAMLPPAEIEKLIAQVPAAESRISPAARLSGFYASFPQDRVWALGVMGAP